MAKKRMIAWALCFFTVLFAAAANTLIAMSTGFDLFSLAIMVAFPVGAIALGVVGASGFYVGAKATSLEPRTIDLVFLMTVCISLAVLVYAAQYVLLGSQSGMSFQHFVETSITSSKHVMYVRGMPTDTAPVAAGDAGWILLVIRLAALLAAARIVYSSLNRRGSSHWQRTDE